MAVKALAWLSCPAAYRNDNSTLLPTGTSGAFAALYVFDPPHAPLTLARPFAPGAAALRMGSGVAPTLFPLPTMLVEAAVVRVRGVVGRAEDHAPGAAAAVAPRRGRATAPAGRGAGHLEWDDNRFYLSPASRLGRSTVPKKEMNLLYI